MLAKIAEHQALKIRDCYTGFLVLVFKIIFHGCCIKVLCVSNKEGGGEAWWLFLKKKKKRHFYKRNKDIFKE